MFRRRGSSKVLRTLIKTKNLNSKPSITLDISEFSILSLFSYMKMALQIPGLKEKIGELEQEVLVLEREKSKAETQRELAESHFTNLTRENN